MKDIKYPAYVKIVEDGHTVSFQIAVYYVGVYCPMYVDGQLVNQGGGHDHRKFLRSYLKDIAAAKARGAVVTESSMCSLNAELERETPMELLA